MLVRRDEMRASKAMQNRVMATENIEVLWNTETLDLLGDDKGLTAVKAKNRLTGDVSEIPASGFFVAIGHKPNTDIFKGQIAPPVIPEPTVEIKPLPQRIIEAIPTIPQAVNTAGTSAIAISAALATPILLKAIRPLMKKVLKKLQKALGKKVKVESVYERRKFQRSLRR